MGVPPRTADASTRPRRPSRRPRSTRTTTPLPAGVTDTSGGGSATTGISSSSGAIARTIVGLAIVLAVVYGLYWLLKSAAKSRTGQSDGRIEVVATTTLAPNRALHLVRSGDELILVGATEQSVTPIRVYSAEEAQAMELELAAAAAASATPRAGRRRRTGMLEALRRRTAR